MIYKIKKNNVKTPLQKGNTLIEALVSLTILSFGLLGIAGLLLASAGQQKNSQSYGVASILVNDITERMRANKADLSLTTSNNNYTTPNVTTYEQALQNTQNSQNNNNSEGDDDNSSSTGCNTVGTNCTTPGTVASSDMRSWLGRINTELPGGAGLILKPNNDDTTSRQVVIMWNDKATSQAENNSTTVDSVNCPMGVITSGVTPVTVRCINVAFRP